MPLVRLLLSIGSLVGLILVLSSEVDLVPGGGLLPRDFSQGHSGVARCSQGPLELERAELAIGVVGRGLVQPQDAVLVALSKRDFGISVPDVLPGHVGGLVNKLAVRSWKRVFTVGISNIAQFQNLPLVTAHAHRVQAVGSQNVLVQLADGSRRVLNIPARKRKNNIGQRVVADILLSELLDFPGRRRLGLPRVDV